jgi:uncharacterized protein (DUF952 family)
MTVVYLLVDGSRGIRMDDATSGADLRILETDLDDASPETLGPLHDRLRAAGAHHVSVLPTTAKGGRPGHLVRAIVPPDATDSVARTLARETGTLGVRTVPAAHAFVAETDRRWVVLELDGTEPEVPVKVAWMDDEVYDVSAEQATAATVAESTGLTQRAVANRAEAIVRDEVSGYVAHLVRRQIWDGRDPTQAYEPAPLQEDGFVHCAPLGRISDIATEMFDAEADLLALILDPRRLASRIRYEPSAGLHYPHVYGPIEGEAIVETRDV